jgi:Protein of unknown function (DUF4238)
MALVDGRGAIALKILIDRDGSKLTDDVRSDWTRLMLAFLYRGPAEIARIEEIFAANLKTNLNADPKNYEMIQESEAATPYDWVEKYHPYLVRDAARHAAIGSIESQRTGHIIMNMEWSTVDVSKSQHELLTSDGPQLRTTGLGKSDCLIALPLSPRFLFIATHDRSVEYALLAKGETAIVSWVNDNIVRGAPRYVYGKTKSHLRFIENRLCLPGTLGPIVPPY